MLPLHLNAMLMTATCSSILLEQGLGLREVADGRKREAGGAAFLFSTQRTVVQQSASEQINAKTSKKVIIVSLRHVTKEKSVCFVPKITGISNDVLF